MTLRGQIRLDPPKDLNDFYQQQATFLERLQNGGVNMYGLRLTVNTAVPTGAPRSNEPTVRLVDPGTGPTFYVYYPSSWVPMSSLSIPAPHLLADTVALGSQHTVVGLTARQVLVATGAATALFRALTAADVQAGTFPAGDFSVNGALLPSADNAAGKTLGNASFRWFDVRAMTATFSGRVTADGVTSSNNAIRVTGAAGTSRDYALQTAGLNRWIFRASTTAEGGANAGSNLQVNAYDDAGTLIETALGITRAAGGAVTVAAARPLIWSSDNAVGSTVGVAGGLTRPYGVYVGTKLVVASALADTEYGSAPVLVGANPVSAAASSAVFLGHISVVRYGANFTFTGSRANGALGAETGLVATNTMVAFRGLGWNTASYVAGGELAFNATETWSLTARGTNASFNMARRGTTVLAETYSLYPEGAQWPTWAIWTSATAAGNTQDALQIIDQAGTPGSGNYGQGISFSRLGESYTGGAWRRMTAVVPRQTTADPDQMGVTWWVHDSATNTDPMSRFADFSVAGDLKSRWYGDLTWSSDNAFDLGATGARSRAVYGYTGDFTTRVTAPLFGTTTAVDTVLQRNSATVLTLGAALATLASTHQLRIRETGGADLDLFGAVADGQLLKRVGTTIVGAAASGVTITEIEIDFGATATYSAEFTITDATVSTSVNVAAWHSAEAATGKTADENAMDALVCRCTPGTGQFTMYVDAFPGPVTGKFKIIYLVG